MIWFSSNDSFELDSGLIWFRANVNVSYLGPPPPPPPFPPFLDLHRVDATRISTHTRAYITYAPRFRTPLPHAPRSRTPLTYAPVDHRQPRRLRLRRDHREGDGASPQCLHGAGSASWRRQGGGCAGDGGAPDSEEQVRARPAE